MKVLYIKRLFQLRLCKITIWKCVLAKTVVPLNVATAMFIPKTKFFLYVLSHTNTNVA